MPADDAVSQEKPSRRLGTPDRLSDAMPAYKNETQRRSTTSPHLLTEGCRLWSPAIAQVRYSRLGAVGSARGMRRQ